MECQDCTKDLEHCHDVLVFHLDGTTQCFDPKCGGEHDTHAFAAWCVDVEWPCDCNRVGHAQPLAA